MADIPVQVDTPSLGGDRPPIDLGLADSTTKGPTAAQAEAERRMAEVNDQKEVAGLASTVAPPELTAAAVAATTTEPSLRDSLIPSVTVAPASNDPAAPAPPVTMPAVNNPYPNDAMRPYYEAPQEGGNPVPQDVLAPSVEAEPQQTDKERLLEVRQAALSNLDRLFQIERGGDILSADQQALRDTYIAALEHWK